MKKFIKNNLLGFILGVIVTSTIGVYATSEFFSKNIEYDNSNSGLSATNAQDAIDELYKKYECRYDVGQEWDFNYTGAEQTFIIPCTGKYKLETWGASGGTAESYGYIGGYGSYSVGEYLNKKDTIIYINVGGQGQTITDAKITVPGGYNGGGSGFSWDNSYLTMDSSSTAGQQIGGGGGATHIALSSGILSTLSSNVSDILIVAGGGGGANYYKNTTTYYHRGNGGNAGGYLSPDAYGISSTQGDATVPGAGQNISSYAYNKGTFGQGASSNAQGTPGGGGGYYGGNSKLAAGASGGSGYIGNSLLSNKAMYCYNCTESSEESTKTISNTCVSSTATEKCSKTGNGYARITLIEID